VFNRALKIAPTGYQVDFSARRLVSAVRSHYPSHCYPIRDSAMTDDKFGARPIRPATIGLYPLLVTIFILLGAWAPLTQASAQAEEIWLLVDTSALTLTVMQGEQTLHTYDNIAIGSNGPTRAKRVKDETTPLGEFRINVVRSSQRTSPVYWYRLPEHGRGQTRDQGRPYQLPGVPGPGYRVAQGGRTAPKHQPWGLPGYSWLGLR